MQGRGGSRWCRGCEDGQMCRDLLAVPTPQFGVGSRCAALGLCPATQLHGEEKPPQLLKNRLCPLRSQKAPGVGFLYPFLCCLSTTQPKLPAATGCQAAQLAGAGG